MTKQELYVSVDNPGTVRKGVLEASKQLIGMLRGYERLRAIRAEKKETLAKLKSSIAEVGMTVSELRQALPDVKLSELPKLPQQTRQKAPSPETTAPKKDATAALPPATKQHHRRGEMEKLEEQLGKIEDKLRGL